MFKSSRQGNSSNNKYGINTDYDSNTNNRDDEHLIDNNCLENDK